MGATREDRESMVVIRQGSTTVLRHLLSADSRNERVVWCDILNQALDNLRAWDTVRARLSFADPAQCPAMTPQTPPAPSPQRSGNPETASLPTFPCQHACCLLILTFCTNYNLVSSNQTNKP